MIIIWIIILITVTTLRKKVIFFFFFFFFWNENTVRHRFIDWEGYLIKKKFLPFGDILLSYWTIRNWLEPINQIEKRCTTVLYFFFSSGNVMCYSCRKFIFILFYLFFWKIIFEKEKKCRRVSDFRKKIIEGCLKYLCLACTNMHEHIGRRRGIHGRI